MSAQGRTVVDGSDDIGLLFLVSSYEEFIFKQLTFLPDGINLVSKFTKPCTALRASQRQEGHLPYRAAKPDFRK